METKKIKLEDFTNESESKAFVNKFDTIPEEIVQNVLSSLSSEEIDKMRSVSSKLNASCAYALRKRFDRVKSEVKSCVENSSSRFSTSVCDRWYYSTGCPSQFSHISDIYKKLTNNRMINRMKAEVKSSPCSREYYYDWLFWVAVEQTLSKSFKHFDIFEGYLAQQYAVSGKTIDVVEDILRWKEKPCPYLHLMNSMLESDGDFSHYFAFQEVYIKWLIHKKNTDRVHLIYVTSIIANNKNSIA